LKEDEFSDLHKFGKTIEEKQNKKHDDSNLYNLKNLNIEKKQIKIKIINKEKIKYLSKKIFKRMVFTKIRFNKNFETIFFLFQKLRNYKKRILNNNAKKIRSYHLVEKTKKRRNKVIIIRKRVPYKINIEEFGKPKDDLDQLISFTFESGIYYTHKKNTTSNHKFKKSIWDFK